jgi:hypothetical protein
MAEEDGGRRRSDRESDCESETRRPESIERERECASLNGKSSLKRECQGA